MNASHQNPASAAPAASVVTTVYNRAHTLARAMRGVLEQSFTDFEYIVVDDGSSDGSASVAESFPDPRITVIRAPHRGRAASLNTAFAACRGEFILIQDSDDVALPGRFEKQIAFLRENPDVGMLGCRIRVTFPGEAKPRAYYVPQNHTDICWLMPVTSAVPFCAAAIRASIMPHSSPFDESMSAAEDYDLQLRLLPLTRFHNLPEYLQLKSNQTDSMGHRLKSSQDLLTRERSLRFLAGQVEARTVYKSRDEIQFARARVEYYYGSIADARRILSSLILRNPFRVAYYRYLFPALLGTPMLSALRTNNRWRIVSPLVRLLPFTRRHFLP
jgi:glycosyltransferase involved in cell wall biosynthesis